MKLAHPNSRTPDGGSEIIFELFVQNGFSEIELASVTAVLQLANRLGQNRIFSWRFTSDNPGLVEGGGGMMVRAMPAIPDYDFADCLIVVGTLHPSPEMWLKRMRAMRHQGLPVILLSTAATAFIKSTRVSSGAVTTHWNDAALLQEEGDHPKLSTCMSEKTGGIVTSAGSGYTAELVLNLIADYMNADVVAEIGNHLLIPTIRGAAAEQPKHIGANTNLFDNHVLRAIQKMEEAIAEPIPMFELAKQLNLSARQLERKFNLTLHTPPARFYKQLRAKRARMLLLETRMPTIDVAIATGFSSTAALSRGLRDCFGQTSSEVRASRNKPNGG